VAAWETRLDEICEAHGLGDEARDGLGRLLELIRDDDGAPTTVRDPASAVDVHVADSLVALEIDVVRSASTIADLGSGAGFPGLALACARLDADVALVESVGRKCMFLERAVAAAGAANVEIACTRAEEWDRRGLDLVCARAVAPLAVLVEYAAPLLRIGGAFVAWKGRHEEDEERAGRQAAPIVGLEPAERRGVSPFEGAEHRTLYVYSKVEETSSRFPRRPGMARKRPLAA